MMTQERIDYFLKLPEAGATEEEFAELQTHYFYADKDDWYTQDEFDLEKYWDYEKIKSFKELVLKQALPVLKKNKLYNFSSFKFPLIENFTDLFETGKKIIEYEIRFKAAQFLGSFSLNNLTFTLDVDFNFSIFHDWVEFNQSNFKNNVDFF